MKYFCSFSVSLRDAMVYQQRRRNVPPKLYNEQRLRERQYSGLNRCTLERLSTFFRMNPRTPSRTPMDNLVDTDSLADRQQENIIRGLAESLMLPQTIELSDESAATTSMAQCLVSGELPSRF